jgi:hypothetical protein
MKSTAEKLEDSYIFMEIVMDVFLRAIDVDNFNPEFLAMTAGVEFERHKQADIPLELVLNKVKDLISDPEMMKAGPKLCADIKAVQPQLEALRAHRDSLSLKERAVEGLIELGMDEAGADRLGDLLTMPLKQKDGGVVYPLASYMEAVFNARKKDPNHPDDDDYPVFWNETIFDLVSDIDPPAYEYDQ